LHFGQNEFEFYEWQQRPRCGRAAGKTYGEVAGCVAPPGTLPRGLDELDVLLQQLVERGTACFGALGEIAQHFRVKM
jgi:hypothetical protein